MKIKDLPKHQRPREKLFELGPENLKDKELLAILLRTGRRGKSAIELAEDLLKKYPIRKLLDVTLDELKHTLVIDSIKVCTILASFELSKRALQTYQTTLPLIETPSDASAQVHHIRGYKKEYFLALYLNARNHLIHTEIISIGTLTSSVVHPREVFAPAIELRASAIILAHNHPSGEPEPSVADIEITDQLFQAGSLLGIELLDHLILTKKTLVSFQELGLLSNKNLV